MRSVGADRPNRIREAKRLLATVPGLTAEVQARAYNITLAELVGGAQDGGKADDATARQNKDGDKPIV